MKIAIIVGILSCFTLPLMAQEVPVIAEAAKTVKSEDLSSGKKEYEEALVAKEKGEYEKALSLLEKASFKETNALYLFEYALLLDLMGDTKQALRVLDRNAEIMKAHPEITTYSLVYQKFQNKLVEPKPVESPSLVGPIVTVAGAATTIAGVVFIVLSQGTKADGNCSTLINPQSQGCDNPIQRTKAETDEIFDNSDTQLLIGSILTATGVGATALGAVLWLGDDTEVKTAFNPIHKNYSIHVQVKF